MRDQLSRNTVFLIVAALAMSVVSCGPTSPNVNNANMQNQNTASANTKADWFPNSACNKDDLNERRDEVSKEILKKINDNSKLKKQHDGDPSNHVPPLFNFHVDIAPDGPYLYATFDGAAAGPDGLKDIAGILNDFNKKGCLLKAFFVPMGMYKPAATYPPVSFGWTVCEDPMVACPNGECHNLPCPTKDSNSNSAANTNTRPGSNSNSNLKSGSDSNSNKTGGTP